MATYALLHGAGSDSWYWHLVVPLLEARGHTVIAPDLPTADDTAGLDDYTDVVVDAVAGHDELVLVAQSLAGLIAPLVCARVPVDALILVAAMVPRPGETGGEWWTNTAQEAARRRNDEREGRDPDAPFDPYVTFLHDVPSEIAEASVDHVNEQSGAVFAEAWPLDAWPDVPTRFLLCRDDRFFPADFQRRVVHDRLGIVAAEMDGGHLPALAHPVELVEHLEALRIDACRS
jgi:pimeloyl-ACP methyl ester carboxylesterase